MTLPAVLPGLPPVVVTGENTAEAARKAAVATAAAEAAAASAVSNRVLRYEEMQRPNLIDWGAGSVNRWVPSTSSASLTYADNDGEGVLRFAHTSSATWRWNIQRDADETKFSYYFVLKAKTGGTGSSAGQVVIYEKDEAWGVSSTEGTTPVATGIALPSGDVSEDQVYSGTITLHADTSRIVFSVENEAATSLDLSCMSAGYGELQGMRKPPQLTHRGLNAMNYPLVQGFERRQIGGAFNAETDGIAAGDTDWLINDNGDIELADATNAMRYWSYWLNRPSHGNWEITSSATVTGPTASDVPGVVFGIGTGSARRFYCYLRNGVIGVFDNDSERNLTDCPDSDVFGDMAYTDGTAATLSLIAREDGTGILTASHPDGETYSLAVTGIPTGPIVPAWRSFAVGKIHSLTCQAIPAHVVRRLDSLGATAGATTAGHLMDFTVLPDRIIAEHSTWAELSGVVGNQGDYARISDDDSGTHTDPITASTVANSGIFQYIAGSPSGWRRVKSKWTRGYTITGLCEITSGAFAGCFATSDDGRLEEGDNSTFSPRIAIWPRDFRGVGPDFAEPLLEIRCDWDHSAQGLTFNSITEQLILACSGDKTIRSYNIYGGAAGTEDVAARIDASAAPLSMAGNTNALAFVPSQGAAGGLLVGQTTSTTIKLFDIETASVVDTFMLGNIPDHFWLDDDEDKLLYTWSANGVDATISKFVLSTESSSVFAVLPRCQAPEAFHLDKATSILRIGCDAGFHKSAAQPALNLVMRYKVPLLV